MTDDDGAVLTLMGWCQTHGKPDHYHALCRREYTTGFGVLTRCSCLEHANDKDTQ
jgi:hypothetical protein